MDKLNIEVTQDDIANSAYDSTTGNPIARALNRVFAIDDFQVYLNTAASKHIGCDFNLPDRVSYFVYRFDHALVVKPFSFTLYANDLYSMNDVPPQEAAELMNWTQTLNIPAPEKLLKQPKQFKEDK